MRCIFGHFSSISIFMGKGSSIYIYKIRRAFIYTYIYTHSQKLSTERKILISGSQSELKRIQFVAEVHGSMQVLQPIALSCQEICKKSSLIRYHLYEGLQKLVVSADRRFLRLLYNLFSRHTCFNDSQKTNGRFLALACCGTH